MLRVRAVGTVDDFLLPGDPGSFAHTVAGMWDDGESRPEWCFVVEDHHQAVGRVGFEVGPSTSDPSWLGTLPPVELRSFGLHLDWSTNPSPTGRALITRGLAEIAADVPDTVEFRVNSRGHPATESALALFRELDMNLFQEKQGFDWNDNGVAIEVPDRLRFISVAESGEATYRRVMGACGEGTIDRNDRLYWGRCGPDNWAAQMMVYLDPADESMWLLGLCGDEPVGYVAVGSDDQWGSTITHVGVAPEHRGNGYIHDLLTSGTAAAQSRGITSMLSDVDTLNMPMIRAMRRAGHRDSDWHVWDFRTPVKGLAAAR